MTVAEAAPLSFPPSPSEDVGADGALDRAGLSLRAAGTEDLDFLRRLHADLRAEEMAGVPWPEAARAAFLASQFDLQHRHFTSAFARARFLIVERAGTPIGRLYVDFSGPDVRLVDIGLLAGERGRGAGEALVKWVQRRARRAGARQVSLHVMHINPRAQALYQKLGFRAAADSGPVASTHQLMAWAAR